MTAVYNGYKDGFVRAVITGENGLWLLCVPAGDAIVVEVESKTLLGAKQAWGRLSGSGTKWALCYSE